MASPSPAQKRAVSSRQAPGRALRDLPRLVEAVQRNCDISDARHAGDYGLCTFLLRMREYYRWENELPLGRALPQDDLGDWLAARERDWDGLEAEDFVKLPLAGGELDPLEADIANRELLARGLVYGAGYGAWLKPVFFLGRLLRIEEREGLTVLVSSCEYARELAAPPAMLQGRTIYLREESARRYLWEKIEEWRWRRQEGAMARALAGHDFDADPEAALQRMAEDLMETMILHEVGEARAGELLGEAWRGLARSQARSPGEVALRAVRDLLADCLSTLPRLVERGDPRALHLYIATIDGPRRRLFAPALEAYERFLGGDTLQALRDVAGEGRERWLAVARELIALDPAAREEAFARLLDRGGDSAP